MRKTKYTVKYTTSFKKDYKRAVKRGLKIELLEQVVALLAMGEPLPEKNRDHDLSGDWIGHRECHILPDWLLIYRIEDNVLVLTLARHLISFFPNCVTATAITTPKSISAQGRNGNREKVLSEASAVKSWSELDTR